MTDATLEARAYSRAEKAADAAIHIIGFVGASFALTHLISDQGSAAPFSQIAALVAYAVGLLGMLLASALYNLSPAGPAKDVLGKVDQGMIFVMIAGSYTPFAVGVFPAWIGIPLCCAVWGLALLGIGLCVGAPALFERVSIPLYMGMGWLVVLVMPPLARAVPGTVLLLLVAGGVVYSLGVIVHAGARMAFHKAAWHGMVVTAAALHLLAVAMILP